MTSKPTRPRVKRASRKGSPPASEFGFSSRLEQVPGGGPYYVSIPAGVSKGIGRRGIVPVVASVNGVAEVRASIIPCGEGRHRLRLNAATREAADATLGRRLSLRLQVDENPTADPFPPDLTDALREVDAFHAFRRMPVGRQNHILRWLEAAVKEETRARRIAQIVEGGARVARGSERPALGGGGEGLTGGRKRSWLTRTEMILMHSRDKTPVDLSDPCAHVTPSMPRAVHRPTPGCEECLKIGSEWVHLRICLTCGHVGCCDDSPNRHATLHHRATGHPVITSGEVEETWAYCYPDDRVLSTG